MNAPPKVRARKWKPKIQTAGAEEAARMASLEEGPALHGPPSLLTEEIAAEIVTHALTTNDTQAALAKTTGMAQQGVGRYIRGVLVPDDYPETKDQWREDVVRFMEIAIWKGTRRLSDTGMGALPLTAVPVSTAILVDKHALMTGNPTSLSLTAHVSLNQSEIQSRLARLRASADPVRVLSAPESA